MDIDRQLEDLLFPVYAHVDFPMDEGYVKKLSKKLGKIVFDNTSAHEKYKGEELRKSVCWMYQYPKQTMEEPYIRTFNISEGFGMVDLRRMRVYLWLEDISVSARIGVDRILRMLFDNQSEPCKVYFKGILIEAKKTANVAQLLEYIDIQGKRRSKTFLQLSRNGFTEEGEAYIQDMIVPRIIQGLFDALKEIVSLDYAGNTDHFPDVVGCALKDSVQDALDGKDDSSWKRQLIGISLFYHFHTLYRSKEQLKYVSKKMNEEKRIWRKTLEDVQKILENYRRIMIDRGIIDIVNNISVIDLYVDPKVNDFEAVGKEQICLADFFDRNNKFAVISRRRYAGDNWVNYLVKLLPTGGQSIITEIFDNTFCSPEQQERLEYIENWVELMLENVESILEDISLPQSNLIQWVMKFVPVIGNFTNYEGNLRVHLLSGEPMESVYYNTNSKYMILKKVAERNRSMNARRFATYVWMGYEVLRVNEVQEDVCQVLENYVYENSGRMLLPCLGETVQELVYLAEKGDAEDGDFEIEKLKSLENALKGCLVLEMDGYRKANKINNSLFMDSFQNYCARTKKMVQEGAFYRRLQESYDEWVQRLLIESASAVLNKEEKSHDLSRNERQETEENDFRFAFPTEREIEKKRNALYTELLKMEEILTATEFDGNKDVPEAAYALIQQVCTYCVLWYERLLQWEEKRYGNVFTQIDRRWRESRERGNLIEWTASQNEYGRDAVAECYDNLWRELSGIVLERCRTNTTRKYGFSFRDRIQSIYDQVRKAGGDDKQ